MASQSQKKLTSLQHKVSSKYFTVGNILTYNEFSG